jgi:hypothetical protein
MVNAKDVILKDLTITGNLYIAQGVAEGDITLDNVKVTGEMVVLGGGENSVKIKNSNIGKIKVIKINGKIRIVASGTTKIGKVMAGSGVKLVEEDLTGEGFGDVEIFELEAGQELVLDGDFNVVTVNVPNANINVTAGTIGTMTIGPKAVGAEVNLGAGVIVKVLDLYAKADISGTGTVTTANIKVSGTTFVQTPTTITLGAGIITTVGGTTITVSTTTIPPIVGPGSTTPTMTNLYITMSSGSRARTVNVEALPNASSSTILGILLQETITNFETLYTNNISVYNTTEGNLLFDTLAFFSYASEENVAGTIYASVAMLSLLKTEVEIAITPYSYQEKKDIMLEVLNVTLANVNNLATVKSDLTRVASKVDFSKLTFNGEQFTSATITGTGGTTFNKTYDVSADATVKTDYINTAFTELFTLSMTKEADYTLEVTLGSIPVSTRTATLRTSTTP